jgi:hypothetical protein
MLQPWIYNERNSLMKPQKSAYGVSFIIFQQDITYMSVFNSGLSKTKDELKFFLLTSENKSAMARLFSKNSE